MKVLAILVMLFSQISFAQPLSQCKIMCEKSYVECLAPLVKTKFDLPVSKSTMDAVDISARECLEGKQACLDTACLHINYPPMCAYANTTKQCVSCCKVLSDKKYSHQFDNIIDFEQCSSYCRQ